MSKKSDSYSSSSSSSSCYLARTKLKTKHGKMIMMMHPPTTTTTWSMKSSLPESPSHHLPPHSDNATDFSTPRNQRLSIAYIENNCSNNYFSDIDEWLEHANKFCNSFNHQNNLADLRMSAVCNSFLTAQEHELYNIILPSVKEESPLHHSQTHLTSCINRYGGGSSSTNQRTRLDSRPKPYDEFLNEIKRKKLEDDKDARRKDKHLRIMHRLRKKEEAINDWELQQTRKAMDHMDKVQNELERKQVMASSKTQKKICSVREKAEKKKLNLRRSTMKKFQQLQIHETRSPSDT